MHSIRQEHDAALLAEAAACAELTRLDDITADNLAEVSRRYGLDFATALLYDRVVNSARCGWRADPALGPNGHVPCTLERYPWAIVPGAFYRENAQSGADGAALLSAGKSLATQATLIPTRSFGSLADNTKIIRDWLTSHPHESTVLISLSKGSREVRDLLDAPDAEQTFANVRLWINLTGLVSGSPLVHWLLAKPWRSWGVRSMFWLRRYPFGTVAELDRTPELLKRPLILPHTTQAVHVVGFPCGHHLSSGLMRRGRRRLAHLGPSDGAGIILADVLNWPGTIVPIWGADHYLRPCFSAAETWLGGLIDACLNRLPTSDSQASQHLHQAGVP